MRKVLVFGASNGGFNYIDNQKNYEIIGLVDNDTEKHNTLYHGVKVYSPEEVKDINFDYIIIASMYIKSIIKQLIEELQIDKNKILYAPKNMMKIKRHPFENPETLILAKKVLIEVTEYLERKGYKYFINFGTLLGIVREGDLIPWDDDIDIAISKDFAETNFFKEHLISILNIIACREKLDITIKIKSDHQDKLLGIDVLIESEEITCFTLSLDLLYFNGENARLPIDILPARFFFDQDLICIEGKALKAPSPYKDYLTYIYQDWNEIRKDVTFKDNTTTFNEPEGIIIKKLFLKGEK